MAFDLATAEPLETAPPPPPSGGRSGGFDLSTARPAFEDTAGGAAVGNPNLQQQGIRGQKTKLGGGESFAAIGGAGVIGGVMGAAAPEILSGASVLVRGAPAPISSLSGPLQFMSTAARAAGRGASATMGAVGGLTGETAGQVAEGLGASPVVAEGARIVGGGFGPEALTLGKNILQTYVTKPALSLAMHLKKQTAKQILNKIDGDPSTLTEKELAYVNTLADEIRSPQPFVSTGGAPKSDEPLEAVGAIMGQRGQSLLDDAERRMIEATNNKAGISGFDAQNRSVADVGDRLQKTILARNEAALKRRSEQYTANEAARDAIVSQREAAGAYPSSTPEYKGLAAELQSTLDNSNVVKRSPSVQAGYQKILSEISATDEAGNQVPVSFQALDDVRRKLGEAFKGKPPEGYDALTKSQAKDLYNKISNIQKAYAGGKDGPQAKLLDDYARDVPEIQMFSSKLGKKVTALDQYREGQYPDPSEIPRNFFKTKASISALKELTGSQAEVNSAAIGYANRELEGKTAAQARNWITKNSEWINEVPVARQVVTKYATKLQDAENSLAAAEAFAKQAAADSSMLTRQSLPAQRAVDLIKSGNTELWAKVIPAINQSPQAKTQMVNAVRQVIADQSNSRTTADFFSRNVRPFLEQSGIASKQEMDFIANKLKDIADLKIPEPEKLGMARRVLLQSTGSWAASAASRGGVEGYKYMANQVPE